jgi:hypothetical protein
VDWYDVDFPAVATARQRLIPVHPDAHIIGADVRDEGWLDAVPTGRPAIIVADGMMAFLSQKSWCRCGTGSSTLPQRRDRLQQLHPSPSGSPSTQAAPRQSPTRSKFPGMDDPHEPEWDPKIKLVKKSCSAGNPRSTSSLRPYAGTTGWLRAAPPGPGRGTIVLHYRF